MVIMARRRSKVDEHVKKSDQIEKDDDIGREEGRLQCKCSDGDGGDKDVGDRFGAALSFE